MTNIHMLKNCIIFLAFAMAIALASCNGQSNSGDGDDTDGAYSNYEDDNGSVWICTGKFAKKYHRDPGCWGLGNCKSAIIKVSVSSAESQGKTPCSKCY